VVDLREDKTILRGLMRTLPQGISETWLPSSLKSWLVARGWSSPSGGLQSAFLRILSVSTSAEKVRKMIPGSKKETGKPLQLLVGAMIRNLGAGESACVCV
jgi:hypothetical protein